MKTSVIEPGETKLIAAKAEIPYTFQGQPLIFEPNTTKLLKIGLCSTPNVISCVDHELSVPVYNFTKAPVKVYGRKTLGAVETADEIQEENRNTVAEVSAGPQNRKDYTGLNSAPKVDKSSVVTSAQQVQFEQNAQKICDSTSLDGNEKRQFFLFLRENSDVFAADDLDLGRNTEILHSINTKDAPPIRQKPYPVAYSEREFVEKKVQEMLSQGAIRPSTSPWASPVVLVRKKDGSTRFCVDYRKLNAITVKDHYPIPKIEDIFLTLGGNKYFSSLDLQSGYWQVAMNPDDIPKTAFATWNGLYEFLVLPFGLCNAPSTFERLMEKVLQGLLWKFCFVYLDDILIASPTFAQHLMHLEAVFGRLRRAGLKLKLRKCDFLKQELLFLGHRVSQHGISVDTSKVEKVRNYPVPTDVSQVKCFLGLAGYYRKFIHKFAQIAAPLNSLLQKNNRFVWSNLCQESFE